MSRPWYPFYPGDYLRDTTHLSCEEHGAYRLLLDVCYTVAIGLPSDDLRLASICRLSLGRWLEIRPTIAAFFQIDADGIWHHKRVNKEKGLRKDRSNAGKTGAKNRWQNDSKPIATAMASAIDNEHGKPIAPQPQPQPHTEEDIVVTRARDARRLALDTEFNLTFWPAYPLKIARKVALEAFYTARGFTSLETIMAGLEGYCALLKGPDPPRAKHASGWLNDERWTDDNTPQVNGVQHDRRNGHAPRGKVGPVEANFAGFAIALDKAERRDRDAQQAADRGADSDATKPLLASDRSTGDAQPSGRRLDRRP